MESCQTKVGFELLTALYEDGLEAVLSGHLERLESILDDAQTAIATLPRAAEGTAAQQSAVAAWRRLQGAMQSSLEETRDELVRTRSGKRAARAYGSAKRAPGMRHCSQA